MNMKKDEKQYKKYILKHLNNIKKHMSETALNLCINDYMVMTKNKEIFSMSYFKHIISLNIQLKKLIYTNNYFMAYGE